MSTLRTAFFVLPYFVTPLLAFLKGGFQSEEIFPRASYLGGWPLGLSPTNEGCPSEAPVSCSDGSTLNQLCCPSGQSCIATLISAYCCPTSADCKVSVTNFPICANSTWTMYIDDVTGYFCCETGLIGVNPQGSYGGICIASDQPVQSSLLAKTATQIGASATSVQVASLSPSSPASASTATSQVVSASASASLTGTGLTTKFSGVGTTATTSSGSPGAASTGSTGAGSSSSNDSTTTTTKKSVLGTPAIIGLAIAGVALILLAGILWALIRRNRKQQPQVIYTPAPSTLPEVMEQKPAPHPTISGMSRYSAATPYRGGSPQPPQYSNLAASQPYDRPVSPLDPSPVANDPYNHFAEMDEQGRYPAELRADRTGA